MARITFDGCDTSRRIIFITNAHLRPYTETDPRYASENAAVAVLVFDVIGSISYASVAFRDLRIILEITEPSSAYFVGHGARNNYSWETPVPGSTDEWYETPDNIPSKRLRIREDSLILFNPERPNDGKTYYVGIKGIAALEDIRVAAIASAIDVRAVAESCRVVIHE
jgi:hypothetical protein